MQIECSLCECQIVKRSREITKKDVVFHQITTGSIHLEALSVMSPVLRRWCRSVSAPGFPPPASSTPPGELSLVHTTPPPQSSPLIGCSGAAVAELETNARLERALGRLSLPRATELVLPSSGARVQLLLPPGYREADDFTFPLLVFL